MSIGFPNPNKKRALIVVDVQSSFVNSENKEVISSIAKVIEKGSYALIVESVFSTEGNLLWERQHRWTCKFTDTLPEIEKIIEESESRVHVRKNTKSAWKGDVDFEKLFKDKGIEEVHIVGFDTNDCVLATAYESFDLGFQTYVIEEATHSAEGSRMRTPAIEILRNVDLTNHSEFIKDFISIS